jgi:hypothetical protein
VITVEPRLVDVSDVVVAPYVGTNVLSGGPEENKGLENSSTKIISPGSGVHQRLRNACKSTTFIQNRIDQRFDVNITFFPLYLKKVSCRRSQKSLETF